MSFHGSRWWAALAIAWRRPFFVGVRSENWSVLEQRAALCVMMSRAIVSVGAMDGKGASFGALARLGNKRRQANGSGRTPQLSRSNGMHAIVLLSHSCDCAAHRRVRMARFARGRVSASEFIDERSTAVPTIPLRWKIIRHSVFHSVRGKWPLQGTLSATSACFQTAQVRCTLVPELQATDSRIGTSSRQDQTASVLLVSLAVLSPANHIARRRRGGRRRCCGSRGPRASAAAAR